MATFLIVALVILIAFALYKKVPVYGFYDLQTCVTVLLMAFLSLRNITDQTTSEISLSIAEYDYHLRAEPTALQEELFDELTVALNAEEVDDEIVGDTRNPGRELAVLGVASLLDGHNGLDKGLLKDVVGQLFVFDNVENIVESTGLMTLEQYIKSFIITFGIQCNQLFVGAIE